MNKLLITLLFPSVISVFSCKCENNEHVSEKAAATGEINILKETKVVSDTVSPKGDSSSMIMKKVEGDLEVSAKELIYVIDKVVNIGDEAASEQNGNLIFTYLKGSRARSEGIAKVLLLLGEKDRERFLSDLIGLMCIDIIDENYDYKRFIQDFRFCEGSFSAKLAFQKCVENQ